MIVSVLIRHSQSIQTLILIWLRKLDIAAKLSINVTRNFFVVLFKKKKTLWAGFQIYLKITCKAIREITKCNLDIIVLLISVN